jgi:hypothetical protein
MRVAASMRITQEVREYAQKDMQEMAEKFAEDGGELYRKT